MTPHEPVPASPDQPDWPTLRNLRQRFLDGTAGHSDYWKSSHELESYDATFAQRIGWKWEFVLNELSALGWTPPEGSITDWACGSGIAGRVFVDHFNVILEPTLHFVDRSALAVQFAVQRAKDRFPDLHVRSDAPQQIETLLVSHVATELSPDALEELVRMASIASASIWVEPGTYEASLTLIAIRERLREQFNVVAPCTHARRCGILDPRNERHWCHFFAPSPQGIFTDPRWSRFAEETGIDLRSLPLSYLVLDRRPWRHPGGNVVRLIGRPNVFKPHVEVLACHDTGVVPLRIPRRTLGMTYRALKKGEHATRAVATWAGEEVTAWEPLQ